MKTIIYKLKNNTTREIEAPDDVVDITLKSLEYGDETAYEFNITKNGGVDRCWANAGLAGGEHLPQMDCWLTGEYVFNGQDNKDFDGDPNTFFNVFEEFEDKQDYEYKFREPVKNMDEKLRFEYEKFARELRNEVIAITELMHNFNVEKDINSEVKDGENFIYLETLNHEQRSPTSSTGLTVEIDNNSENGRVRCYRKNSGFTSPGDNNVQPEYSGVSYFNNKDEFESFKQELVIKEQERQEQIQMDHSDSLSLGQ